MLRLQKVFSYFKPGVRSDTLSAQALPTPAAQDEQQSIDNHAAAAGHAASTSQAAQHTEQAVQVEQPLTLQQNRQAEVQEADKQRLTHAASKPPVTRTSSGNPGAFHDDDQQLLRHASSGSMSSCLGGSTRQHSLLSESSRASRRSSLMRSDSLTESHVPPVLQQRDSLAFSASSEQQQVFSSEAFWANSNWSYGSHSDQNQRMHMEDRISCRDLTREAAFSGCKRAAFFAVFDGHAGHEAADYLEKHLLSYVLDAGAEMLRTAPLQALADAVKQAEGEILSKFMAARCNAGSTLLALLLVDDKLHIANVGDSRAILGRGSDAQQLTRDHKPACREEQQRIEADDPQADISSDGYMYGELAVARAIGSAHIKRDPSKRALIPTPDLISVQLHAEDDFVVIATDGLWDKVDNAEVVSVTRRNLAGSRGEPQGTEAAVSSRAEGASRALVDRALRRSSQDNISVITLLLHGRAISLPKSNSMLFKRTQLSGLSGTESPRCSTPCSGISTPATATPRSSTPVGMPLPPSSSAPTPSRMSNA